MNLRLPWCSPNPVSESFCFELAGPHYSLIKALFARGWRGLALSYGNSE